MVKHQISADKSHNELPEWAERYARNRVLPFILLMFVSAIIGAIIPAGIKLTMLLIRGGNPILISLCIVYNVAIVGIWLWMSATGQLSQIFQGFTENLYRQEGSAIPVIPGRRVSRRRTMLVGMVGGFTFPWLLYLLMFFFLHVLKVPPVYIQPAMATVLVPALIVKTLVGSDKPKWLSLTAPALYAIHALLVLAGVQMSVFGVRDFITNDQLFPTGQQIFDVCMPLFVCIMLSLLARHIYSRYALLRLKIAALSPVDQFMEADKKGNDDGNA